MYTVINDINEVVATYSDLIVLVEHNFVEVKSIIERLERLHNFTTEIEKAETKFSELISRAAAVRKDIDGMKAAKHSLLKELGL